MSEGALVLNRPENGHGSNGRPKSGSHARPFSAGKIRPKRSHSPTGSERSNDDKSYGTYASAMLEVKNNRKRAEGDLQLLENRILMLKGEEQKALLKVKETKSRASDILRLKKRNEDALNKKLEEKLMREMKVKEKRDQTLQEKRQRQERMSRTRNQIHKARNQIYVETRGDGAKFVTDNHMLKQKIEEDNRKKAAAVKAKKEEALRKKREAQRKKEEENHRKYLEKQEEENRRTAAAEQRIRELEKIEREMIERLKKTQIMQQKAYSELQESLEI